MDEWEGRTDPSCGAPLVLFNDALLEKCRYIIVGQSIPQGAISIVLELKQESSQSTGCRLDYVYGWLWTNSVERSLSDGKNNTSVETRKNNVHKYDDAAATLERDAFISSPPFASSLSTNTV